MINKEVERSIITKFRPTIWRLFLRGIDEYKMISEGDKIAVCVSGGKDSMLLAKLFQELLKHSDVPFTVKFIVMNPGYNEKNLIFGKIYLASNLVKHDTFSLSYIL